LAGARLAVARFADDFARPVDRLAVERFLVGRFEVARFAEARLVVRFAVPASPT
jgi:hypothetical protein